MYRIALKMLIGDRAKYLILVTAISFATLLITQQTSIFLGLLRWSTATIKNTRVPLWIVDPLVEQPGEVFPLLDTDLNRVRSIRGVKWAVPLFFSIQQVRLENGVFKPVQLIGLDTTTLIGGPSKMITGNLYHIWDHSSVIIDEIAVQHFSSSNDKKIGVGDTFEINDREVKVAGICKAEYSFFGYPYVYTTFDKAKELIPFQRRNVSFILGAPESENDLIEVARKVENETGLKVFTEDEFFWSTIRWIFKNTGIPISFSMIVIMGFLVGIAVSGQTFYSFVLENIKHLGALKAMGASNTLLCRMLIFQALLVGFLGFGIGIGIASLFGHIALRQGNIPFFMPYQILTGTFFIILTICTFSAILGIIRIRKLQAFEVFHG
jgi:putative ABC transport system permease protein